MATAARAEAGGFAVRANEPVRQREFVWIHGKERAKRTARGVDDVFYDEISR